MNDEARKARGMEARRLAAVEFVLRHEGGYVNDPADPGGETRYGISKRSYPDEDIVALTRERAARLLLRDYWRPLGCDELAWPLAALVFDAGVNMGSATASRLLQRALNDPRPGALREDGAIGPRTLRVARELSARGETLRDIAARFCLRRLERYVAIADGMGHTRFLGGWTRRAVAAHAFATLEPAPEAEGPTLLAH